MTTATMTQQEQYERALSRARDEAIEIAGHGTRKSDGARVWAVTSAHEDNRWYLVAREADRFVCNCPAGQHRPERMCKHKALVRASLLAERKLAAHVATPLATPLPDRGTI